MSTLSGRIRVGLSLLKLVAAMAVVVTILGLVASWILTATKSEEDKQKNISNLHVCANAVLLATDAGEQNAKMPPLTGLFGGKEGTFHYHLLVYLDTDTLRLVSTYRPTIRVPPYLAADDPSQKNDGAGAANFPVNLRLFYSQGGLGELQTDSAVRFRRMFSEVTDGTSNTLLFATKYHACGANGGSLWWDPGKNAIDSPTAATFGKSMGLWQQAPTPTACDPRAGTAVSFRPDYILVAMCDSSVRTVSTRITPATWQALHTWGAGDVVGSDWPE